MAKVSIEVPDSVLDTATKAELKALHAKIAKQEREITQLKYAVSTYKAREGKLQGVIDAVRNIDPEYDLY